MGKLLGYHILLIYSWNEVLLMVSAFEELHNDIQVIFRVMYTMEVIQGKLWAHMNVNRRIV